MLSLPGLLSVRPLLIPGQSAHLGEVWGANAETNHQ